MLQFCHAETETKLKLKKSKRNILKTFILLSSVAALVFVVYAYIQTTKQQEDKNSVSVIISNSTETSAADTENIYSDSIQYTTAADDNRTIPNSTQLNVEFINQEPELPTGCEITSLAEVLNFYGYNIDKEELAKNYLPMKDTADEGCFIDYFLGSPWDERGSGCFAPAIVKAANAFLSDHSSNLTAYVISYSSVHTLLEEVADGHPVIVWTSYDYSITDVTYRDVPLSNGEYFSWPAYEHCVVLSGYNLDDNTVTFADPSYGIVTHTIDEFTYFYQKYFYQAAVIK